MSVRAIRARSGRTDRPADDDRPLQADAVGDEQADALAPEATGQRGQLLVVRQARGRLRSPPETRQDRVRAPGRTSRGSRPRRSAAGSSTSPAMPSSRRSISPATPSGSSVEAIAFGALAVQHVRSSGGQVGVPQVEVGRVQLVRLDRQPLEGLERGDPLGPQPVGLGIVRRRAPARDPWSAKRNGRSVGARRTGRGRGDATRHPSDPSISSFTRRLNSMAYSIGSSLVNTSRKPWTIRLVASFSVRPRLIR